MSAYNRFRWGLLLLAGAAAVGLGIPACGSESTTGQGGSAGSGGATTSVTTTSPGGGGGGGSTPCGEIEQTPGDCKKNVCDDGDVVAVPDDTDVPDDGNACTADACEGGSVTNTPTAGGAPCDRGGGKVCDGEGACVACVVNTDCTDTAAPVCNRAHQCVPAGCADMQKNGDETDVDCGGACGPTCQPGQACDDGDDCLHGVCKMNSCVVPTCGDGVKNGTETDVDCGGACASGFNPKKCGPDQGCKVDSDCAGDECSGTTCVPNCSDGVQNNGETNVDCGGPSCDACENGASCADAADCASGFCADGVCCDTACDADCQACSAADKLSGPDGVCGTAKAGQPCGPAPTCADGQQTAQDTCNAAGACVDAGLTPCSPYVCGASTCTTTCAGDDDCAAPATCVQGACILPEGEPCGANAHCQSGFCVDGVCCDTACTATCQACSAAKKGAGPDGACGDVLAGTDPDNECAGTLNCGGGACQLPLGQACTDPAQCASGSCVDGVCCNVPCAGPCQACTAAKKGAGNNGTCGNIAINTDPDDECSGAAACNGSGACALGVLGAACAGDADCASGFCADGVCCNSACDGACQACTAAKKGSGLNGLCASIATGMDPDDECTGDTVCAPGGCKLPNGAACISSAACISGFCTDGVCCNTACAATCQACTAEKKGSGADGACGEITAGTDPDDECGGPTTCSGAGTCALLPDGSACVLGVECQSSFCVDGVCCATACTGQCQACTTAKKGAGTNGTCGPIAGTTDPDDECPGATACSGTGTCTLLPNGSACTTSAECNSTFCVDGVCCNNACTGTCQACSAAKKGQGGDGTCGSIVANTDPDDECAGAAACGGSTSCSFLSNGAACTQGPECSSGFCADGVCCSTVCSLSCQACTAAKKGTGSNGTCGAVASGTDPDDECPGAEVCGSGGCKLPIGAACTAATDCVTGNCVDGVCCNTACTGACQACTAAKKGNGVDGTCSNIAAATDPDDECGGAATCNGSGACALFANGTACAVGTECATGNCVDGVCCNTACAGSCQACTAAKKGSGANGTCGNIAINTDPDDECPGAGICNGSAACKLPNAEPCTQAADCLSNACADGICCNSACTGTCQACTAAKKGSGADGTCGSIAVGTDPDNECFGMFSCNGATACALLTQGTACTQGGECASGNCVDGVCCNSACDSLCQACTGLKKGSGPDGTCANITAGGDPDDECPGAQVCGAGACKTPLGAACTTASECSTGNCVDGVCCESTCTGTCKACSAAKKGFGADGVCENIEAGEDPDDECFDTFSCSGAGACALLAQGTACTANGQCVTGNCVDGVCCNSSCTTPCQACSAAKKGSGADGACGTIAANTDPDAECPGAQVCNGSSACRLPLAEPCLVNGDCVSNACVDGVCCSSSCTGACQACTAAKKGQGADGVCGSIAMGTDPDNECFGAIVCNGSNACGTLANGTACTAGPECASGNCVDGVCCNSACGNLCQACTAIKKGQGADGTCGSILLGGDPDDECPGALACNGATSNPVCKLPGGAACTDNSECATGFCADGVCCNAACTGTCQACTAAKKGSGADGFCGPVEAGSDPDDECFGALSCSGGTTCALLAQGSACIAGGECQSGFCVDGFCCNSACTNICNACSAAKKNSGANGTCGVIQSGTDPDNECFGATLCSGSSSCALLTNGTACTQNPECASGNCVDGVCCNSPCGGSCQACTAAKKGSGANGTCGNVATSTDPDDECPGATACTATQACGLFANGLGCTLDDECASGSCVDGVCCNEACDGLCQACIGDLTMVSDGTCADIVAGTDPEDECSDMTSSPNCGGDLMCGP